MNRAGLLAASVIPGAVFCYAVLAGILMKRITPVPIVAMPEKQRVGLRPGTARSRQPVIA